MSPADVRPVRADAVRRHAAVQAAATRKLRAICAAGWSDQTLELARRWYPDASLECARIGEETGLPSDIVAEVVALLSPRCSWELNIDGARAVIDGWLEREPAYPWGPLPRSCDYAWAWLEGTSEGLGFGPKTTCFARNLKGDLSEVTVDVWAARAVGRDHERMGRLEYAAIARSYRIVAAEQGLEPATFQALVWILTRDGDEPTTSTSIAEDEVHQCICGAHLIPQTDPSSTVCDDPSGVCMFSSSRTND